MNTWMNNPQYLAQVGHFLGGYAFITTTLVFSLVCGVGWVPVVVALVAGVIAASVKEFWYDMEYELPKQTLEDSLMDWGFYVLGGAVGMCVAALATWVATSLNHCAP